MSENRFTVADFNREDDEFYGNGREVFAETKIEAASELEAELAEKRSTLTLRERVEYRRRIDELEGVVYPPVSPAQMRRIARITERELPRILRSA